MRVTSLVLSAFLILVIALPEASGDSPEWHPNITEVFVDDPDNPTSIMIIGEDLLLGSNPPVVTLGDDPTPLNIDGTPTDDFIEASLPPMISFGDYLLSLSAANGQDEDDDSDSDSDSDSGDEYDLTIGAVGPQGEQGKLGPPGDQGEQGKIGPAGADGAQGAQGKMGPAGADGAQGAQGKIGPAGADGAQGAQGKIGPAGADGAQGAQGKIGPAGADGAQGAQGKMGMPGLPGAQGAQGKIGPQGDQGKIGAQGEQGKIGPPGPVGGTGNNVVNNLRVDDNMQPFLGVNYIIALQGVFPSRNSISDPTIGEIVMFGGNFAPQSWALCDGQLLAINTNQALFSILGTTYGGDGQTTFALPDLRGRVPLHPGSGAGLSNRGLGERGGTETEAPHNHDHTP